MPCASPAFSAGPTSSAAGFSDFRRRCGRRGRARSAAASRTATPRGRRGRRARRRPAARDLADPGQRLAVDLVRVEPAQLLGQAVRHGAPGQRDPPVRLARLAQRAVRPVRPEQLDRARTGGPAAPTPSPPRRPSTRLHLHPEPARRASRPAGPWTARSPSPLTVAAVIFSCGGKSSADGEQRAPVRQPGPRQVRVARRVASPALLERLDRVLRRQRVGDPALRRAGRSGPSTARPAPRPATRPRPARPAAAAARPAGAGLVRGERAVAAQHDDLAGPGVAADPDLRVQPRRRPRCAAGQHDHPARVLAAGGVAGLDGLLDAPPSSVTITSVSTRPRASTPPSRAAPPACCSPPRSWWTAGR